MFVPVRIEAAPPLLALAAPATTHPQLRLRAAEIALKNGRVLRVDESNEPVTLARHVAALDWTQS